MTPDDVDFNSPEWTARKAEIHAWVGEVKAREKARKAAAKARRLNGVPRVYQQAAAAVLELLGEIGPLIDRDLVAAYFERARERGWPNVSLHTVQAARSRLTSSRRVARVGTAVNGATGRTVTLWGLAEPTATSAPPTRVEREPMWDDE